MEKTFLKAALDHVRTEKETLADFRASLNTLTPADKQWFRERFALEYGYTMVDGQSAQQATQTAIALPAAREVERGAA